MSIMGLGGSSSSDKDKDRDKDRSKEDSSGEESWTKACRAVLLVMKRILMVESEVARGVVDSVWRESGATQGGVGFDQPINRYSW
jgi:beclin 1